MNERFGEKVKAIFDSITVLQAKDSDLKRDNANINGDSPMGAMLQYGANTAKEYNLEYLIKPAIAELHRDGWIHIHDLDFYAWTTTCTQIELRKLFKNGFNTGHGHLRAPKSIGSYAALAAIAIQSNQNDQHGGQSVVDFDYAMAEGVRYTYQKYLKEGYEICERLNDLKDKAWILDYAMEKTTRDTYQAMEGFIHNLNTMHSRAGAQVPFSSINYGTDISWEGRLAIEQLLLATEAGLGHGETPIFPIQIFRVKEGVNYNPDDPNYDLFKLAMKVSAKRLFPNFAFIDAPFNLQYYKPGHPETEVAYMGCRTRVMGNVYDSSREIAPGRGNLSFTSINLPRLGIESKGDYLTFFKLLDKMLDATMQQLLDRYKIQASRVVRNFPFLMGEGVWMDSDGLSPDDTVGEVLKHGTLSSDEEPVLGVERIGGNMIHSFAITNYLGDRIKLDLREPEVSGFLIKSVIGLGPVKATVNTTEVVTNDGSMFNSARLSQRNIVFQIVFVDTVYGETIEDVRQKSYKYFPAKKSVEIIIETDNRYVRTNGYVESNEPNIFSSQEGTSISIICPDPFFYSAGEDGNNVTDFYSIDPMFEFPFSNESLTEPLLVFGEIQIKTEGVITYYGDAEIGVTIYIHAIGPASNINIYNTETREVMKIDTVKLQKLTGKGIVASDDIVINTSKGDKSITLIREGVSYNILNCLDKNTDWFTLAKGDNIFAFTADSGVTNLQFRIENKVIYEGV